MKQLLVVLLLVLTAAACTAPEATQPGAQQVEPVTVTDTPAVQQVAVDTDNDEEVDVTVTQREEVTEVVVDIDDAQQVEIDLAEACTPGEVFTYDGADGSVDAEIIGLTTYKGGEFCQAEAVVVIPSPIGDIVTENTYYFNDDQSEFWVISSVENPSLPEPQVTEIHIIDGEIQ